MFQFPPAFNDIKLPDTLRYVNDGEQPSGSGLRGGQANGSGTQSNKREVDFELKMERERIVLTPQDNYEVTIGCDSIVRKMMKCFAMRVKNMDNLELPLASNVGFNGFLIVGVPGTGKSVFLKGAGVRLAKILKQNVSYFNVTSSLIKSSYHGESEKQVDALFAAADKYPPTILAIDEVDALFGERTEKEDQHTRALKNTLLGALQGLKPHPNVIVCGATNLPFEMDKAFIRRFGMRFIIRLPKPDDRIEILRHAIKTQTTNILLETEGKELNSKKIKDLTEGYTGSELIECVKNAAVHVAKFEYNGVVLEDSEFHEQILQIEENDKPVTIATGVMTTDILVEFGIRHGRPSFKPHESRKLEEFAKEYCDNYDDTVGEEEPDSYTSSCVNVPLICCFNRC